MVQTTGAHEKQLASCRITTYGLLTECLWFFHAILAIWSGVVPAVQMPDTDN